MTSNGPPKRVTAPWTPPGDPARRSPGRRVGSPENAAPKGGRSHPRLNIAGRPIAQKYCEGKVKRISKGRSKALEIAEGEAYAAVARLRTVLRGRGFTASVTVVPLGGPSARVRRGAEAGELRARRFAAGVTPSSAERLFARRRLRTEGIRTGSPRAGGTGRGVPRGARRSVVRLRAGARRRVSRGAFRPPPVFRGAGEKAPYDPS